MRVCSSVQSSVEFFFRSTISTWIFTITRNLCMNELRRRSRHRASPLDYADGTGEHRSGRCSNRRGSQTSVMPLSRLSYWKKSSKPSPSCPKGNAQPSSCFARRTSLTTRWPQYCGFLFQQRKRSSIAVERNRKGSCGRTCARAVGRSLFTR